MFGFIFCGTVVCLVIPNKSAILVKGDLAASDVEEIRKASLKEIRSVLKAQTKDCLEHAALGQACVGMKRYWLVDVQRIEVLKPDVVQVTCGTATNHRIARFLAHKGSNGWVPAQISY